MKALTLNEISILKNILAEQSAGTIHLHDACGAQYFSLENADGRAQEIIRNYLTEKNMKAVFTNNGHEFGIEEL